MKRTRKFLVAAFILISYAGLAGGSEPYVKVSEQGSKEFFLFMNKIGEEDDKATITLKDLKGEVIYREKLKGDGEYRKLFDVNALPEGDYMLEIEGQTRIKAWSLSISETGLQVNQKESGFFKPTLVEMDGARLGLSLFNSKQVPARLSIFEPTTGNAFFTEALGKDLVISRVFDLSLLKKGSYTISVEVDGRTYNDTVEL